MSTLNQLQEDNKQCGCNACVHDRFVASTRKALLSTPARRQAVREVLSAALTLLDELGYQEPLCYCPTCAPEEWENWSEGWRKNGFTKSEYPCNIS